MTLGGGPPPSRRAASGARLDGQSRPPL